MYLQHPSLGWMESWPGAFSRSGGNCRGRGAPWRAGIEQGPERRRKAAWRNGGNGLETAGHGAEGGNTPRRHSAAIGGTACAENAVAVACVIRPPIRRTARVGCTADRCGDVPVKGIGRRPGGMRQEAEDKGQHERQHHGVDGHAAANSQKPEETPVHGRK